MRSLYPVNLLGVAQNNFWFMQLFAKKTNNVTAILLKKFCDANRDIKVFVA
ncbi:MAG: hypothetical protein DSM106950_23365 [Stigonema ocellatum SAG 48.90 = DSM 106950]|nr:hypothetical protein [Stigonema ocellatum SAG 48.90 = DSM 106950]